MNKFGLGTLTLGGVNTYTGDTTISVGSLALASSGSLLLDINGSGVSTSILGAGAIDLGGRLVFDVTDVSAPGAWNVLAVNTLTETYGGDFGVTFAVGPNSFAATRTSPGVWTCDIASMGRAVFTESTGVLSFVPEPGTLSLFVAGLLSLLAYCWRQKRAA
ncbi:MAG: autotransporter-associated beta strand repeat-containing protein [Pirellulales bacterium]|nr:autotransporter-associated beta strand repeat-containing protein [Pirellulales bacterium]